MNDRYDAILALRAIRQFDERAVEEADLAAVLEAARWTGSSKNRQNWAFVVIDDPQVKEQLCEAGDFMVPVQNAPAVICLVQEPEGYEFDTGRLAQNIMLAADAIGLATCPVTLHREEIASAVLALPEGTRCRYAVAIGYPAAGSGATKMGGRKPLEALVHRNRYDG